IHFSFLFFSFLFSPFLPSFLPSCILCYYQTYSIRHEKQVVRDKPVDGFQVVLKGKFFFPCCLALPFCLSLSLQIHSCVSTSSSSSPT
ncbi:hypothetical protein IWX46DRAFT_604709, partial [Phyllosticta citricarpa]